MVSLYSNRRVTRIPRDLGESFLLPVFPLSKANSKESMRKNIGRQGGLRKGIGWVLRGSGHRSSGLVVGYYGVLALLPTTAMNLGPIEPQTSNRKMTQNVNL